jgi:uncharacterized protein HemX
VTSADVIPLETRIAHRGSRGSQGNAFQDQPANDDGHGNQNHDGERLASSEPRVVQGRSMTRDLAIGAISSVVAALVVGLAVWLFGLGAGVADLDTRTQALQATLQTTNQLVDQNAQQIGANATQISQLGHQLELLVTSLETTRDSITALAAQVVEERQASREDFKELRDLTTQNAIAIRDLLNRERQAPGP